MATRTKAERGLAIGAVLGGVTAGLGFGALSSGLCDAADCDGSFLEGFLAGVLVGGTGGGLTGLVVGSAFPADGSTTGGWSWSVRTGVRGANARDFSGLGPVAEVRGLRGITDRVRFGVAVEYLGGESRRSTYGLRTRDGSFVETTDVRELDISGVRIVAARLLGADPGSAEGRHATGYLLGAVGVLPTWERTTTFFRQEDGGVEESSYASFVPAPGGGVGVGFLIPIGDRWALDLGARGDVVVGIGSEGVVPMAQVTAGLHRGR